MSMRLMNYTLSTVADTMLAVLASPRQVLAPTSKLHDTFQPLQQCCRYLLLKLLLLLHQTRRCVRQQQSTQPLLHLRIALHCCPIVQTDST